MGILSAVSDSVVTKSGAYRGQPRGRLLMAQGRVPMGEVLTASNPAPDDGPRSRGLLRRFAPWLVIGGWLLVVAAAFPLATKLSSVTTDRVADYLPASAESTRVTGIEDKLPGGGNNDFLVVYHRASGVTDADTAAAERHLADLTRRY